MKQESGYPGWTLERRLRWLIAMQLTVPRLRSPQGCHLPLCPYLLACRSDQLLEEVMSRIRAAAAIIPVGWELPTFSAAWHKDTSRSPVNVRFKEPAAADRLFGWTPGRIMPLSRCGRGAG